MVSAAALAPWCGPRRRPDPPGLRAAPYRYHAIYVIPRDARSRFRRVAPGLQASAFGASSLLERLYGRAIRFDMGTRCGRGYLDISEFRLSATRARLRAAARSRDPGALFDLVRGELRAAGFGVARKGATYRRLLGHTINYIAWLDGPAPPRACGQATSLVDSRRLFWNSNNLGGKLALIFRRGERFCGANTVRHEIGHNLGALQRPAPHATRDGTHCTDALEDTMCGLRAPAVTGGRRHALYFDYGNDDYWDPPRGRPLKWWTLNLSWFICPDARCNRAPRR